MLLPCLPELVLQKSSNRSSDIMIYIFLLPFVVLLLGQKMVPLPSFTYECLKGGKHQMICFCGCLPCTLTQGRKKKDVLFVDVCCYCIE